MSESVLRVRRCWLVGPTVLATLYEIAGVAGFTTQIVIQGDGPPLLWSKSYAFERDAVEELLRALEHASAHTQYRVREVPIRHDDAKAAPPASN
jgi:hypothetical protein